MQRLASSIRLQDNNSRFRILHDFFRPDHRMTKADLDEMIARGQNIADVFCPLALRYHKDYIQQIRALCACFSSKSSHRACPMS